MKITMHFIGENNRRSDDDLLQTYKMHKARAGKIFLEIESNWSDYNLDSKRRFINLFRSDISCQILPSTRGNPNGGLKFSADNAKILLDKLIKFAQAQSVIISDSEYTDFLTSLEVAGYLSGDEKQTYLNEKKSICCTTRKDQIKIAGTEKSAERALALAEYFFHYPDTVSALRWLNKAYKWDPEKVDLKQLVTTTFVEHLRKIYSAANLFSDELKTIREVIAEHCPVEEIYFSVFDPDIAINESLTEFLITTKTLRHLNLSVPNRTYKQMTDHHIKYIAEGLRKNGSIETLNISSQDITDSGMSELQSAVNDNPSSKLKMVNSFETPSTLEFVSRSSGMPRP